MQDPDMVAIIEVRSQDFVEPFAQLLFFFSSRRRHTIWTGDWSSDVCSSDLAVPGAAGDGGGGAFWAVAQVVAPSAGWAGTRREHLVVTAWGQSVAHALAGRRTLRGDALGAAEVPGQ